MRGALVSAIAVALMACGNAGDQTPPASANDRVEAPAPAHEFAAPLPPGEDPTVQPTPEADSPPTHVTSIASVGDVECTFELLSTNLDPGTTGVSRWAVALMKMDTKPGSCMHKGTIPLAPFSYEMPVGALALVPSTKMLAVTFSGQFDPTSVIYTRLVQIDYETGQLLHEGEMAVDGAPLWPPPAALHPTGLDARNNDVILRGTGDFPGAGGGTSFVATYTDFLGVDPQRPSPATSALSQ